MLKETLDINLTKTCGIIYRDGVEKAPLQEYKKAKYSATKINNRKHLN